MEVAIFVIALAMAFGAGFAFGSLKGYKDALPRRDMRGRFINKD